MMSLPVMIRTGLVYYGKWLFIDIVYSMTSVWDWKVFMKVLLKSKKKYPSCLIGVN
jgi:hypothetical protein